MLNLTETSLKRMFDKCDMPLSRILRLDFVDLARRVADRPSQLQQMTLEQETAVVADRKLLLMAIRVLGQWTLP